MTHKNQSGRSMVEMLGVLAIIGVLSIGGIMGYSYGMNRYRANETVNDIMLRGVDIMTQTARGLEPNLESEWGIKGSIYNMEAIHDETNDIWGIVVDGVPSKVCKMVGEALKSMATIYVRDVDYSTNDEACDSSEKNTMEFYFESITEVMGTECKTDTDCGANKYCDMGLCFSGARPEATSRVFDNECTSDADCNKGWDTSCSVCDLTLNRCVESWDMNRQSCTLSDNTLGKCGAGECIPTGCTYDTQKCKSQSYCASDNLSDCDAFYPGETGVCISFNDRFSKIDGTPYYRSNGPLSWWDANAGCESVNKRLLSLDELVVDWDETAYKNGKQYFTPTAISEQLRTNWNSNDYPYIWTKNKTDEDNSCKSYGIWLGNSDIGVDYDGRSQGYRHYYAICK